MAHLKVSQAKAPSQEEIDNSNEAEREAHLYIAERRKQYDPDSLKRRGVARFTDSQIRFFAQQIFRLANVWILMSILYVGIMVGINVGNDLRSTPKAIFLGLVLLIFAFSVFRVARSAASYIENQSQGVGKLVESVFFMMLTMVITGGILAATYLIATL